MHYASADGHTDILLKLLYKKHVPTNVANILGQTPLHIASSWGQAQTSRTLLKKEETDHLCYTENPLEPLLCSLDAVDEEKHTALHYALIFGETEVLSELFRFSPNITQPDDVRSAVPAVVCCFMALR